MDINYSYHKTTRIEKNIIRIEVARKVIELLPQLPHIETSMRHQSLLKSSLFSARIEGNTLRAEEVERPRRKSSRSVEKSEVFNILSALRWIYSSRAPKKIKIDTILRMHRFVLNGISQDAGRFRSVPSAIFNTAGVAIYMTPPPSQINALMQKLVTITNVSKEHGVIQAARSHFAFEKIHPFLDGNGRVGRLLSSLILKNAGYGFRGLIVLEEYLNDQREEYYDLLGTLQKDITDFIAFFSEAVAISSEKAVEMLKKIKEEKPQDTLLPRRREILDIIVDHKLISFDSIKRRFHSVPESSLHYDLRMLIKKGFIKKLGATRGVLYTTSVGV